MKKGTEININIDSNIQEYQITKIKDLPDRFSYEDDNTIIEAYIFGMDMIVYEKGMTLLTLKLSDKTDSIIARVGVPNSSITETLENVKLGTSWRFYGECINKEYDGINVIKMEQIPQVATPVIDKEQEKYFFFESLDVETVKSRKKEALKDKLKELER